MSRNVLRWVVACALGTLSLNAMAETIDEVVVKGQLLRPEDSAFSATVLDSTVIREQALADVDELLRLVPGMVVRDL